MKNILDLIGNTPLVELKNINEKYNLKSKIFAKIELDNPTGSVKDRSALKIITDAINNGMLKKGDTIIEASSGNMGISLAFVAKELDYKVIVVMPDSMSVERRKMIQIQGAQIILTEGPKGMQGSIDKLKEMIKLDSSIIYLDQFNNISTKLAHHITGKEIIKQIPSIDIFINGFGTGGTISGVGEMLKQYNKNIKVIGIEPSTSPLISKGISASHGIQGIGANFIPSVLNRNVIDEFVLVDYESACYYAKELFTLENIFCGISSGANLKVAIDVAKKEKNKNIVIIIPDKGDRYYSNNI